MSAGGPCPAGAGGGPGGASCAVGVSPGGVSMFRWLEVLEKEFDKAFVDVDLLLGEIDPDQADITYEGRQKMTSLSSCFAQLCHKAQTVSQINHKLEVSCGRWRGWHSTPVIRPHLTHPWNDPRKLPAGAPGLPTWRGSARARRKGVRWG